MSSFKAFFIKHRTIILAIGIPLIVIIVILSLPIIPASIPVTESYWETETVTQPYTDNETYTDMVPYQATVTHTDTVINGPVSYGNWSQSFKVDNPGATVTINITNGGGGYYYSPQHYSTGDNYTPPYGPYAPYGPWTPLSPWYSNWYIPGYAANQSWALVTVSYPAQVTQYQPVTRTREVTRYREVATQVRKERTVTQNVRISVWESLFRPQSST